jgi:hypothetical protein
MSITMHGHPFGARQVTIERAPRTFRLTVGVNAQNDSRNFAPVGVFCVRIKQPKIRHQMATIIASQHVRVWRNIGNIWLKRRFVRRHPWTADPLRAI